MTARRPTILLAATAVLAGALALGPTPAGAQAAPCTEPYSPVAHVYTAPSTPVTQALPDVPGSDVVRQPGGFAPDTDDDGTVDAIDDGQGAGATVTRGSGVVELAAAGASSVSVSGVPDIDGDGRDELSVAVRGGADEGTYLVPGTVPDGPSAVADAGILVASDPGSARAQADGSDRLLVSHGGVVSVPLLDTYDAGDVLALGPGGDATVAGPVVSREGILVAFVELAEPALGLVVLGPSTTLDAAELLLVDVAGPGVETRLTTAPHPFVATGTGPVGGLEVLVGSEGIFVRLEQSGRGGTAGYLWSLDDPCTPRALVDVVGPTSTVPNGSAPPATPVDAAARFTG